jgi:predicted dehydrogenase
MVRIGVVGAGFMGRSFAHIVHQYPLATLAGVADTNLDLAESVAGAFGAPAYASAEALVQEGMLDGLIVATVEDAHVAPCVAALHDGIAVMVEKPLATNLADAHAIINAAEAKGALLTVGHVLHFDNRYATLAEQVRSGAVGDPLTIYARRLNGIGSPRRLKGRCSLPMFLGVHDYDVVRWVAGAEPIEVTAVERRGFLAGLGWDVEDASFATFRFDNGVVAMVELNWIMPDGHPTGFDQRLDVTGSAGRIELVGHYGGLVAMDGERSSWPDTALWPTVYGDVVGALEKETVHFIECIRKGSSPRVSATDALIAVKMAVAAERSARSGETVLLADI